MTRENAVRVLAGSMVLLSLALGLWVSAWWFLLTTFVGVNLIQSAFTGFCPAEIIFARMGLRNAPCAPEPVATASKPMTPAGSAS